VLDVRDPRAPVRRLCAAAARHGNLEQSSPNPWRLLLGGQRQGHFRRRPPFADERAPVTAIRFRARRRTAERDGGAARRVLDGGCTASPAYVRHFAPVRARADRFMAGRWRRPPPHLVHGRTPGPMLSALLEWFSHSPTICSNFPHRRHGGISGAPARRPGATGFPGIKTRAGENVPWPGEPDATGLHHALVHHATPALRRLAATPVW